MKKMLAVSIFGVCIGAANAERLPSVDTEMIHARYCMETQQPVPRPGQSVRVCTCPDGRYGPPSCSIVTG